MRWTTHVDVSGRGMPDASGWKRGMRRVVLLALLHSVGAWAEQGPPPVPLVGARPAAATLTPEPSRADPDGQGTVGELIERIHDAELVELRTTYNGNYGASLFFYPAQMAYYVALFQDKHFWRVIKTQDEARAEAVYATFVPQTAALAQGEIRRTRLQAQQAFVERMIVWAQARTRRLQADLSVAQTQQAKSQVRQQQMQAEIATLDAQNERARAELRRMQNTVRALQWQVEGGTP